MSEAETLYDGFVSEMAQRLGKIDVKLAMSVMYFERKFPDISPSVILEIHYKDKTDLERKRFEIRSKRGLQSSIGVHEVVARGNLSLKEIQEISADPNIEKITGSATCASY
jgi:hypothetical protein